jgi:hypothetical protein
MSYWLGVYIQHSRQVDPLGLGLMPAPSAPAVPHSGFLEGDMRNPDVRLLRLETQLSGMGEGVVELEQRLDKLDDVVVHLRAKQEADHDELQRTEDMLAAMAGDIHRMKKR